MLNCGPRQRLARTQPSTSERTRQPGPIGQKRGGGIVEVILVLGAIVIIVCGVHAWHESLISGYPGPRSALRHSSFDTPPITAVAISPDQQAAISVGTAGVIRVHDLQSRKPSAEMASRFREACAIAISPDGSQFIVGTGAGQIEVWIGDDICVPSINRQGHSGRITSLAFHPDGQSFLTCGDDQRNIFWDINTLEPLFELPSVSSAIHTVSFLAQGKQLLTGNQHGQLQLWDLATKKILSTTLVSSSAVVHDSIIEGIAVLSDETEVLAVARSGEMGIWDLRTGERKLKFRHPGQPIASLCMLKNGRHVVTGGIDGQIQIWNIQTGLCIRSIPAHAGTVLALEATTDSQLLVSAGWDGTLKFWDLYP